MSSVFFKWLKKYQSQHVKLFEIRIPLSINKVLFEHSHTMLMATFTLKCQELSSCNRDDIALQRQKYLWKYGKFADCW